MGCRLAFQTPCQFRFPRAEGRVREESPKSAELCVAPPLVRPSGSPSARGISSARGRWGVRPRSSNGRDWDFHPRPAELVVPLLPLMVLQFVLGGGGSPFKVLVKPRFSASHNQRTSREVGGDAGRWPALVVLRGAAMPRQVDSEVPRLDFHRCLGLARPLRALRARLRRSFPRFARRISPRAL